MKRPLIFSLCLLLCACGAKSQTSSDSSITSLQIRDRNGFSETISSKERLSRYETVDFLAAQPYERVLRVYGKNSEGKNRSKITTYHSNGQIHQYLELVDGRAHGSYKAWHPNGKIHLDVSVIEGAGDLSELAQAGWVFDGLSRAWDEQGNLVAEILYSKGILSGTSRYYHTNGNLSRSIPYDRGVVHGSVLFFNESGAVVEESRFLLGKRHGESVSPFYNEIYDNDLLLHGRYRDGEGRTIAEIKDGQGNQARLKNGTLYSLSEYKNGLPEGIIKLFSPTGSLDCQYSVRAGKKWGEEIHYYSAKNQPKISLPWNDDQLQGTLKTWYENGIAESQREMHANKKKGMSMAWFTDGSLMLVEEYDEDQLMSGTYFKKGSKEPLSKIDKGSGTATLYDGDGQFIKKVTYERGKPTP